MENNPWKLWVNCRGLYGLWVIFPVGYGLWVINMGYTDYGLFSPWVVFRYVFFGRQNFVKLFDWAIFDKHAEWVK